MEKNGLSLVLLGVLASVSAASLARGCLDFDLESFFYFFRAARWVLLRCIVCSLEAVVLIGTHTQDRQLFAPEPISAVATKLGKFMAGTRKLSNPRRRRVTTSGGKDIHTTHASTSNDIEKLNHGWAGSNSGKWELQEQKRQKQQHMHHNWHYSSRP